MITTHTSKNGVKSFYVRVGNGKSKTFSEKDFRTRTDARNAARQYELDLRSGKQFKAIPTLDQYADRLLDHWAKEPLRKGTKRKDSTLDTLASNLVRVREKFGSRLLDAIDRGMGRDWALTAPANSIKTACQLYNRAIEEKLVTENPFRSLAPVSTGRSDERPPTPEEFERLLDGWKVHKDYAPMGRALQSFAGAEGMRPGELYVLEWEPRILPPPYNDVCSYIDFNTGRIHVNWGLYDGRLQRPKTDESRREAVLTKEGRAALRGLERTSNYVFVSKTGQRLSQVTLWNYWQAVCASAGLDFAFYHATKHYCCHRWYVVDGKSPNAIAHQMGWSVDAVMELLRIYGHGRIGWEHEFEEKVVDLDEARQRKAAGD